VGAEPEDAFDDIDATVRDGRRGDEPIAAPAWYSQADATGAEGPGPAMVPVRAESPR